MQVPTHLVPHSNPRHGEQRMSNIIIEVMSSPTHPPFFNPSSFSLSLIPSLIVLANFHQMLARQIQLVSDVRHLKCHRQHS